MFQASEFLISVDFRVSGVSVLSFVSCFGV